VSIKSKPDCCDSLRDQFAAAALTGLLAQGDDGSFSEEWYARAAYRWADAMIAERSRSYEKHDAKRGDLHTAGAYASAAVAAEHAG
jgi:hypothetical protein